MGVELLKGIIIRVKPTAKFIFWKRNSIGEKQLGWCNVKHYKQQFIICSAHVTGRGSICMPVCFMSRRTDPTSRIKPRIDTDLCSTPSQAFHNMWLAVWLVSCWTDQLKCQQNVSLLSSLHVDISGVGCWLKTNRKARCMHFQQSLGSVVRMSWRWS